TFASRSTASRRRARSSRRRAPRRGRAPPPSRSARATWRNPDAAVGSADMNTDQVRELAHRVSKPFRVTDGRRFRLRDVDPGDTGDLKAEDKARAVEALHSGIAALAQLQDVLYAQDRWSLLL